MKLDAIKDIYRPGDIRIKDWEEVERLISKDDIKTQAGRCASCGIPFCHGLGCPLGNVIPEMNRAVKDGNWRLAWEILSATSAFPEFTSRVCPALCENACVQNINAEAVMIRQIEKAITETAFERGYIRESVIQNRTGKRAAVIGSGPSGLAAADNLNKKGHSVTVFEKNHKAGGLLRYGIPDFKLDKSVIDRRLAIMESSGIIFQPDTEAGKDIAGDYLKKKFDVVIAATGTPVARDLPIPGRELQNVFFALEFLSAQNRFISGEDRFLKISAQNKDVVIIGGGDTGSDCLGVALRQNPKSVTQIDIMPEPPEERSHSTPWPDWPYMIKYSSSHKEGGRRLWNVVSKSFIGKAGTLTGIETAKTSWTFSPEGRPLKFEELEGTKEILKADLALIATGFAGAAPEAFISQLGLEIGPKGELTGKPEEGIFTCGDGRTGQSLVVRAIADGKKAASAADDYLQNL